MNGISSKAETRAHFTDPTFSFTNPAWRAFPRKVHRELNLASNELYHNPDTGAGALICPLADRYPDFICSKTGLDYLHDAKLQGKISEGFIVLTRWTDTERIIVKITPVDEVVAGLRGTTPNQGKGPYGPFYWLTEGGTSSDDPPF